MVVFCTHLAAATGGGSGGGAGSLGGFALGQDSTRCDDKDAMPSGGASSGGSMAQGMAGQGGTRPAFNHPVVELAGMMHDVHMKGLPPPSILCRPNYR